MRYTSDAAMDDRGLREVEHEREHERWKDKIEVRLDNRQVFFLFFGSALVACLLFILGVLVGKRLESRGKAVAPEVEDPLALLDKVAATPAAEGPSPPPSLPRVPDPVTRPRPEPARPKVAAPKAAVAPADEAPAEPEPAAELEAKPVKAPPAPRPAAHAVAPTAPPADPTKGKAGRFTLQLGAFPDRAEAEAFARKFGPQPYVVPAEIAGKGLWYRVRVGDFATPQDALVAKLAFEKEHGVIALVAGPTVPTPTPPPAH
jgi:DedD protein